MLNENDNNFVSKKTQIAVVDQLECRMILENFDEFDICIIKADNNSHLKH